MRYVNRISSLASASLLLMAPPSYALPFSIIPVGSLPTSVASGSTASASYTVTNATNFNPPSNLVKWLPPNVSVNTATTTCLPTSAFTLSPGQSCTLALTISGAVNRNDPDPHHHLFVCMSDLATCAGPNPENSLNVAAGGADPIILTAIGFSNTDGLPFIRTSQNGGSTWPTATISNVVVSMVFTSAQCSGSGTSAICAAAGENANTSDAIVASSTDGGASWVRRAIPGLTGGSFNSISCSGSGANGFCAAVGSKDPVLVASSIDGGVTWARRSVAGLPAGAAQYNAVDCIGSGGTGLCVAIGDYISSTDDTSTAISNDGGETWTRKAGPSLVGQATRAYGVSCFENGANATCVAGGAGESDTSARLFISSDNGDTWSVNNDFSAESERFNVVDCTGSGASTICAAGGSKGLIAVSTDGAATWSAKTVTGLPDPIAFQGMSCTGSGSDAVCAGVAHNVDTVHALVASVDGGNTWTLKTIAGLPANYYWHGVSCTGSGATAACVAVASDDDNTEQPFLVQSVNGGVDWSLVTNANLPVQAAFRAVASVS